MNEQARRQLEALVRQAGSAVCSDPERGGTLLREHLANYPRECSSLIQALQAGVPVKLAAYDSGPIETRLQRLTRELARDRNMAEEAALWSVETWAVALGVLSEEERASIPALQKIPVNPPIAGGAISESEKDISLPQPLSPPALAPPLLAQESSGFEKRVSASLPESQWQTEPPGLPSLPPITPNIPPLPGESRSAPAAPPSFEPTTQSFSPAVPGLLPPSAPPVSRSKAPLFVMVCAGLLAVGGLIAAVGLIAFFLTRPQQPVENTKITVSNPPDTGAPGISPPSTGTGDGTNTNASPDSENTIKSPEDTPPDTGDIEAPPPGGTTQGAQPQEMTDSRLDALMEQVSLRNLTQADLSGRSLEDLRLIRNMPYARHGYRFHDPKLLEFFQQKSWYHPVSGDAGQAWKAMSAVERHNTEFIHGYEKSRGGK